MKRHINSPVAGQLLSRLVAAGDRIEADTEIAIVESMKMHIPVSAEQSGRVGRWLVEEKSLIAEGQALVELEA
ncbi:MAG TPA: acetyl-CoA carboxylase biotin carboxyl carrier protein subunit [Hyphomicrobiaceae bacterium]|jgi:acetyl-CoA carboxylase biotin carboxyl carrier protein